MNKAQGMVMFYGMKIIVALIIFILGKWIAAGIRNSLKKVMTKRNVDETLVPFATNLIYTLLMVFVIIAALGQLGIQTASLVAILGAAGLAVGLALQGSLANFASGVLIIIFRPFKVGDYIEGGGTAGTVESIQIFITKLKTPDNKEIYVPNSTMMGGNIMNYSAQKTRRVDLSAGIGYNDDIDKARKVLENILSSDSRVLKDPAPTVAVVELADSSVNFVVRPWVKSEDYWGVYFDVTEAIKKRFNEAGISIPYPQQDVHIFQEK